MKTTLKQKLDTLYKKIGLSEDPITRWLIAMVAMAVLVALFGYFFYQRTHLFDAYQVLSTAEESDLEDTQYTMLGDYVIKYSHEGVSAVDLQNQIQWSVAYSVQTPICDVCGSSMVIAEQQGTQVYVLGSSGLTGSFNVSLPIRKAYVASNGVTALVMDDTDVSWIKLYDTAGTEIVSLKTTMSETGYPMDIAITPNARKMMVSYLGTDGGNLTGTIAFYDFSSAESEEGHLVNSYQYTDTVFPEVYYAGDTTPVAVGDNCYAVFTSDNNPRLKKMTEIDREIVSCFHDESNIGFVFHSSDTQIRYDMEVYSYSGKKTMSTTCSFEYTGIRMEDGEILLYDSRNLNIWRLSGRQKLAVDYEKEVRYFEPISGLRKYLVITGSSMDQIRLK